MKILITGNKGFIAQNLIYRLKNNPKYKLFFFNKKSSLVNFKKNLLDSDVIFHLAGSNGDVNKKIFFLNNYLLTKKICSILKHSKKKIKIIYSSSTQIKKKNYYGYSKINAEKELKNLQKNNAKIQVAIYRLPNIFGKWSKPFYNSAIATFCYQISHNKPVKIINKRKKITLVYIDDLINCFIKIVKVKKIKKFLQNPYPQYKIFIDKLVKIIMSFYYMDPCDADKLAVGFVKKLYSTYLTFLPSAKKFINIKSITDSRGEFIEFVKNKKFGQISIVKIASKKTRGNHYHHSKIERFLVISGKVEFTFLNIKNIQEKYKIICDENSNKVVITKPGWAHNIKNIGNKKASIIIWSNEVFDKKNPDTYSYRVS